MIKDVQEYLQKWNKENNPFYPDEMRWDRLKVNEFLHDYKLQQMAHEAVLGDVAIKEKVLPWLERLQHYLSSGSTFCFDNQYDEADGEELQKLIDTIKGNVL